MDKISMIREVKAQTNCGLKEAKDMVEEYLSEGVPSQEGIVALVVNRMKNKPPIPRSEEYRNTIRRRVEGIRNLIDFIDWDDEFNEDDLPEIRETMDKIADESLNIKDRLTFRLEDTLQEEEVD